MVTLVASPWKGWVDRTPGHEGSGAILKCNLAGNVADALTGTEWLHSTDAGKSWTSNRLPSNFTATDFGVHPDGSILVSGWNIGSYSSAFALWRYSSAAGWVQLSTKTKFPDGKSTADVTMGSFAHFDGEWWALATGSLLIHSVDGVSWTVRPDPDKPAVPLIASGLWRFQDHLAVTCFRSNSSTSNYTVILLAPGGAFSSIDSPNILRLGNASYYGGLKVSDGTTSPVKMPLDWYLYSNGFAEGQISGDRFSALASDGKLLTGVYGSAMTQISLNHLCFAKSGDLWLVGYGNGNLWSGTNLLDAPRVNDDFRARELTAYDHEFVCDGYHSSDGAKWQPRGAVAASGVRPAGTLGDRFIFPLVQEGTVRQFLSPSIYPVPEASTIGWGQVFSGETAALKVESSTAAHSIQLIRDSTAGLSVKNTDIGHTWTYLYGAFQFKKRWLLSGDAGSSLPSRFILTSSDGKTWKSSSLPGDCVIGKSDTKLIALYNSARAYTSVDGLAWTPIVPKGMPGGRVDELVSYHGYFVGRWQNYLYVSADGVSWARVSTPRVITGLSANLHTMLARTQDDAILQPAGEIESGPTLELPQSQESTSTSLHGNTRYEVFAADADGDLASVSCSVDGVKIASLATGPFVFDISPATSGPHAVEFTAADSKGRISRTTARLEILAGGLANSPPRALDHDLTNAILFKDSYYRLYQDRVWIWEGDDLWHPVTLPGYQVKALVANGEAIVAKVADGILSSRDGVDWNHQAFYCSALAVHEELFYAATSYGKSFVSRDGVEWTLTEATVEGWWADALFGLKVLNGNAMVTEDGGKSWIKIPGATSFTRVVPVNGGFLIFGQEQVVRLRRGASAFERIDQTLGWSDPLYNASFGGVVLVGSPGKFLLSTTDGVNFTSLAPPPNRFAVNLVHFENQWIAISTDMICASTDLQTWRVIYDFRNLPGYTPRDIPVTVSKWGRDSLYLETSDVLLHPDFSVTPWTKPGFRAFLPDGIHGGLRFKDRVISLSGAYYTRSADSPEWESALIDPAEGFVPFYPHQWPLASGSDYPASTLYAASSQRFAMMIPDYFYPAANSIVTSDDGRAFTVHNWTGPIPLTQVTQLAASPGGFMAAAPGCVLSSPDGVEWTKHPVIDGLVPTSLFYFKGSWHLGGVRNTYLEIWSSTDGTTWARRAKLPGASVEIAPVKTIGFIAGGSARMYGGNSKWIRSSDGVTWEYDTVLNTNRSSIGFVPKGSHPEGIIGEWYHGAVILDALTGAIIRKIDLSGYTLRWLDGDLHLRTEDSYVEFTENDPRLSEISSPAGTFGVGDSVQIDVSAQELGEVPPDLEFFLTTDEKLGNRDDVALGHGSWQQGTPLPDGSRRFRLALPTSVTPGNFRVAARLVLGLKPDAAVENNQIVSARTDIEVPGYQLRLTTSGSGTVNASDPRVLYPLGARLQLEAIPQQGFTFRGWSGSKVSTESVISVLMKADKQLTVAFTPGFRVAVNAVGNGAVNGAPTLAVVLPGESLQLSQTAADGWKFAGWSIDGELLTGNALSFSPVADTRIEAVFNPDFDALRDRALPPAADRAWTADPDGDGLSNWQEILLSTDPMSAQRPGQTVTRESDKLRLVFSRPQGRTGYPWIAPEFSGDLTTWEPPDSTRLTERVLEQAGGMETVEVTLPISSSSRGYFRLRMPPPPEP